MRDTPSQPPPPADGRGRSSGSDLLPRLRGGGGWVGASLLTEIGRAGRSLGCRRPLPTSPARGRSGRSRSLDLPPPRPAPPPRGGGGGDRVADLPRTQRPPHRAGDAQRGRRSAAWCPAPPAAARPRGT